MKKDKLEQYITDNRAAFDENEVPAMVWQGIEQELDKGVERKVKVFSLLKYAAAAVVVLGVGLLMGLRLAAGDPLEGSEAYQEFVEAEQYYQNEVRVKLSEYQSLGQETQSLEDDLAQLDAVYNELKAELIRNKDMNTDRVVEAMIENYRTKVDILETVLKRTKKKSTNELNLEDYEANEI